MNHTPLYQYIFNMLDYADILIPKIEADEMFASNYFITLIQIEYVLDSYGRGLVLHTAKDEGRSDAESLFKQAEQRMDALRLTLRRLAQKYDFDDVIRQYTEGVNRNWKHLPDDHPILLELKEKGLL